MTPSLRDTNDLETGWMLAGCTSVTVQLYNYTTVQLYNCTAVQLHNCTILIEQLYSHRCTIVQSQLHNRALSRFDLRNHTIALFQLHNCEIVQLCNCTIVEWYHCTIRQLYNCMLVQLYSHTCTPNKHWFNVTTVQMFNQNCAIVQLCKCTVVQLQFWLWNCVVVIVHVKNNTYSTQWICANVTALLWLYRDCLPCCKTQNRASHSQAWLWLDLLCVPH